MINLIYLVNIFDFFKFSLVLVFICLIFKIIILIFKKCFKYKTELKLYVYILKMYKKQSEQIFNITTFLIILLFILSVLDIWQNVVNLLLGTVLSYYFTAFIITPTIRYTNELHYKSLFVIMKKFYLSSKFYDSTLKLVKLFINRDYETLKTEEDKRNELKTLKNQVLINLKYDIEIPSQEDILIAIEEFSSHIDYTEDFSSFDENLSINIFKAEALKYHKNLNMLYNISNKNKVEIIKILRNIISAVLRFKECIINNDNTIDGQKTQILKYLEILENEENQS